MSQRGKNLRAIASSPIGRKVLTGITGLGLTIFVLVHMAGNLGYFSSDPDAYNKYADFLISGTGPLIYVVEIGLLAFALMHIYLGIKIYFGKREARPVDYKKYRSAGKPSKQTGSSRTMIFTGMVILIFLVIHLQTFKFGPGMEEGYVATLDDGSQIRDLKRLVTEKFQHPLYAFGYPAVMLLLGFHLRHGIWSAFQSLGATNPRITPILYTVGGLVAALIAIGFLILPLYIYFSA